MTLKIIYFNLFNLVEHKLIYIKNAIQIKVSFYLKFLMIENFEET